MTRQERLAAMREKRDEILKWGIGNATLATADLIGRDLDWLLAQLEERDRGFDLATARIGRLEAALRDVRVGLIEGDRKGDTIRDVDRALNPEGGE